MAGWFRISVQARGGKRWPPQRVCGLGYIQDFLELAVRGGHAVVLEALPDGGD